MSHSNQTPSQFLAAPYLQNKISISEGGSRAVATQAGAHVPINLPVTKGMKLELQLFDEGKTLIMLFTKCSTESLVKHVNYCSRSTCGNDYFNVSLICSLYS